MNENKIFVENAIEYLCWLQIKDYFIRKRVARIFCDLRLKALSLMLLDGAFPFNTFTALKYFRQFYSFH